MTFAHLPPGVWHRWHAPGTAEDTVFLAAGDGPQIEVADDGAAGMERGPRDLWVDAAMVSAISAAGRTAAGLEGAELDLLSGSSFRSLRLAGARLWSGIRLGAARAPVSRASCRPSTAQPSTRHMNH
ncbi:hypothetical protein AB0442_37100 [Kitasatospora sp. NPDC085895]|uniref:hypothetical protein n=1 Tax=Kitasatospora sp. NPDC085895 TaxID=3155057 RepID=UPI00345108FB